MTCTYIWLTLKGVTSLVNWHNIGTTVRQTKQKEEKTPCFTLQPHKRLQKAAKISEAFGKFEFVTTDSVCWSSGFQKTVCLI